MPSVTVTTPCVTATHSKNEEVNVSWPLVPVSGLTVEAANLNFGCNSVTIKNFSPAPANTGENIGGLAIFARWCGSGSGAVCNSAQPGQPTPAAPLMNESFFSYPPYGTGLSNWTDWAVSAAGQPTTTGRWSTQEQTTVSGPETTTMAFLKVTSVRNSSLLFYDPFGGGDFTYTGGITFDSFGSESSGDGRAGLSFRLSDNPFSQTNKKPTPDAGSQGYDVVLTNGTGEGPSPRARVPCSC